MQLFRIETDIFKMRKEESSSLLELHATYVDNWDISNGIVQCARSVNLWIMGLATVRQIFYVSSARKWGIGQLIAQTKVHKNAADAGLYFTTMRTAHQYGGFTK